jgi:AMMECR1 domain-containing protein
LPEAELLAEMAKILNFHWQLINKTRKPICLWTDVEEIHTSKEGVIVAQGETLPGLILPQAKKEWLWNFAPAPEIYKDRSVQLKMCAFKVNF